MKVRAGAKAPGSNKLIEVELEDSDMQDVEGWNEMSRAKRWRMMTDQADLMVVEYLLRRGDISREYAETRIREIKGQT